MKHSLRPRKPANLPESVHHQLNMYALAASAAGVGMLALTTPTEARIVYTPTHHVIAEGGHYRLDVNHDGITDFALQAQISPVLKRCSMRFNEQLRVWMQLTLLSRLMLAPPLGQAANTKCSMPSKAGMTGLVRKATWSLTPREIFTARRPKGETPRTAIASGARPLEIQQHP